MKLASILIIGSTAIGFFAPLPTLASIIYELEMGVEVRCRDGNSLAVAVLGRVGMLTRINGTSAAAYPIFEFGDYQTVDSRCFLRNLDPQTIREFSDSVVRYCIYGREPYCRYD